MRNRKRNLSSDDDLPLSKTKTEDDLPLSVVKRKRSSTDDSKNPNIYSNLCRRSDEPCEFCDVVSKSKYASLLHNVRHIIIPLINQTIYTCQDCLFCFTSLDDLKNHNLFKHPNFNATVVLPQLKLSGPEADRSTNNCNVFGTKPGNLFGSPDIVEEVPKETPPLPNGSIKSRLRFEDDEINWNDNVLIDLTTDCQVKVEIFKPPWLEPEPEVEQESHTECTLVSVHFDELMKPGVFSCRKCSRTYPTRLEAIIHEGTHITLKNTQINLCQICDQYILGDLKVLQHHQSVYHRPIIDKRPSIDNKPFIDLIPSIDTRPVRHKNHVIDNIITDIESGEEEKWEPQKTKTATLMLCDVCFAFCKNTMKVVYDCIGNLCELGKRFRCDKCGGKFFDIRLVKRISKQYRNTGICKHRKRTNEERLKSISQRLKMLKM